MAELSIFACQVGEADGKRRKGWEGKQVDVGGLGSGSGRAEPPSGPPRVRLAGWAAHTMKALSIEPSRGLAGVDLERKQAVALVDANPELRAGRHSKRSSMRSDSPIRR
jgi:hypothetical protein